MHVLNVFFLKLIPLIPEKEQENKEQMVYLGFKKGESVMSLPHKDSQVNENFLEIIKKDEESNDLYSEFSHQQLNKSVFDLDKEKQPLIPQKYIEEATFHNPATTMERDDTGDSYHDVDPENLINFNNFNKFLNEQRVSQEGKVEENFPSDDLKPSEKKMNLSMKPDFSFKVEDEGKKQPLENEKAVVTNATVKNEDLLTLAHTFTQDLEKNLQITNLQPQSIY